MRLNFLSTKVTVVLFLGIKFIKGEWWDDLDVWENPDRTSWSQSTDHVQYCRTTPHPGAPGNNDYGTDCDKYINCYSGKHNESDQEDAFYVTVLWCEFCPPGTSVEDCPNGTFIYNNEVQKCVHPNTLTSDEHRCGTKRSDSECNGPEESDDLHRLGKSSYYIFQNEERTNLVNWKEAKEMCEEVGLKLAKIDDLQTDVLVSRELEKFVRPLGWIDNWYWLDAKFDRKLQTYVWQDTMQAINFSNFYYRHPRPKGYGDFFDNEGNYISDPTVEYCLAQSMPLPFPKTYGQHHDEHLVPYGFHTAWWERDCDNRKKGNVLCESVDPDCQTSREDSIYTESTGTYFQEFWPMSNRRFVVKWTPTSFEDAKSLCEDHGMKLYSPHEDDSCLSQNLKNWMKTVTSYSFWTDVKYKVEEREFEYSDGKEVPEGARNVTHRISKRKASQAIEETCASVTWNYEEFPKNPNFCNCTYESIVLSPENCKNKIGVICQHTDDEIRECTTEYYEKAIPRGQYVSFDAEELHPKITEYYPFNSDPNWLGGVIRSAYKQQGSSGQCPEGFKRVLSNLTYWGTEEEFEESGHKYDFLAPYWMRMKNGTCTLSTVSYDPEEKTLSREITEEDCSKWLGFILCRRKPLLNGMAPVIVEGRAMGRRLMLDNHEPKNVIVLD